MQGKEKFKFFLNIVLTPIIIVAMVVIAISMRGKMILESEADQESQREVLNLIDHSHKF